MNNQEIIDLLEEINEERISLEQSKAYRIGDYITSFSNYIRDGKVKNGLELVRDYIHSNRLKRYNHENIIYSELFDEKSLVNYTTRPKVVVYTCITGGYDKVLLPLTLFSNVDYVLFSDDEKNKEIYPYIVKSIPNNILQYGRLLANRYIKMHPFLFFEDYDYSIYVDGNIKIISDLSMYSYATKVRTGVAMHLHRARNCIYDEAKACKILGKGEYHKIKKKLLKYKKEGFPRQYGMNECNLIVCDLKNKNMRMLMESWWKEVIDSRAMRDQISWPYILWRNGFTLEDVGNLGDNIMMNKKLIIRKHSKLSNARDT